MNGIKSWSAVFALAVSGLLTVTAECAQSGNPASFPWMNTTLTPDERAGLVLKELTLDEKIMLIHGQGSPFGGTNPNAYLSNGGDGFSLGVPRLGIPPLQMIGSAYGVRFSAANGRYSTAMPSNLALTSSWDPEAACRVRGADWQGRARAGLQHEPCRRREPCPGAPQRPQF